MLNRYSAVSISSCSSSLVSKSNSNVAIFALLNSFATYWFLGLNLLLPLPCANNTIPLAPEGTVKLPSTTTPPTGILTSVSCESCRHHPCWFFMTFLFVLFEQLDYFFVGCLAQNPRRIVLWPGNTQECRGIRLGLLVFLAL